MLTAKADITEDLPDRITLWSDYRCKDSIKAVPGARWDPEARLWTVPKTWPACLALRAEFGAGLTIESGLRDWAGSISGRKKKLAILHDVLEPEDALPELPGFKELYPYQQVDATLIHTAERYLLMNETGAGKSRSALAGLSLLDKDNADVFPLVIVAPKSMLITWKREAEPFFPGKDIRVCSGTPTQMKKKLEPGGDIYIIGWGSLRKYSRLSSYGSIKLTDDEKTPKELQALGLKSAIFDECHRAKNPASKWTRAAWSVADPCRYRIGLTGTPIQDTPEDLYGILHLLLPEEYPTKTPYVDRYLHVDWNMWGGREILGLHPERGEEFMANFRTVSRRLTKALVLPFLPEKVYETRWVTLPSKLRKAYDSMQTRLIAELETTTMTAENALVKAGRLVQLANAGGDLDADGKFTMEAPSPKIDAFLDDVLQGDYDGQQVVVFSDSRELIELLSVEMEKKKLSHVAITGAVTGDDRQTAMDRFQSGEVDFCLLTRAGGEGITLTAASTMVRLMRPWSYTIHKQVEDRVHRIGSERHDHVTYVDYITEDTIELGQMVRLNGKEARAQEVLRDDELLALLKGGK